MAEEESLLTQEEMEAIGLEPDQVSRSLFWRIIEKERESVSGVIQRFV
jgi:hypothetical protein